MRANMVIAIPPPRKGGVYSDDITTAGKVYKTPDEWKGHKVRIHVHTGDLEIQFNSTVTTSVVYGQNSTWNSTTKALTVHNNTGLTIAKDTWEEFDICEGINDDLDAYFSTDTSDTAASWVGFITEM